MLLVAAWVVEFALIPDSGGLFVERTITHGMQNLPVDYSTKL